MNFLAEVTAKLQHEQSLPAARIRTLLASSSLRPIAEQPASITASEALRLWRTRLKNTAITQKKIDGLSEVVRRLEFLTPQKKISQFGFTGEDAAITLLFEKTSGTFIGSITVSNSR